MKGSIVFGIILMPVVNSKKVLPSFFFFFANSDCYTHDETNAHSMSKCSMSDRKNFHEEKLPTATIGAVTLNINCKRMRLIFLVL